MPAQTNIISVEVSSTNDTNTVPVAPVAAPESTGLPPPGTMAASPAPVTSNSAPAEAAPAPTANPAPAMTITAPVATQSLTTTRTESTFVTLNLGLSLIPALLAMAGFVLYSCGLTRAKNCGHTSTLLLVGVFFALLGFWAGGFAVQTGGVGDMHAALAPSAMMTAHNALDHELGFMAGDHYWGLMGSEGFFLQSDEGARESLAALFFTGAIYLAIAVAAALGAALERGRMLPMVVGSFLIGAILCPLVANWTWGGGWLAALGHEFGLGYGFVDQGGAVVIHATAGTLALVIAKVLGPRYGRVGREKVYRAIPGHNMPFVIVGASLLLIAFTAANTFAPGSASGAPEVAAVNTLLAAAGGLLITYLAAGWARKRPEPAALCRGLLGGAVAVSAGSALVDPWAAFVTGVIAGLVVIAAMNWLDWRRIDDPTGATAVHGAAGAWGALALGFFANGVAGSGCNSVDGPVRGLFFGGAWRQLAAQAIGVAAVVVTILILGFICFGLIQKILGTRAGLVEEVEGLDWSQTGAFGYQPDVEPGSGNGAPVDGGKASS